MKQENDTPESEAAEGGEQIHPLEVMRQAFQAMKSTFQEDDGTIFTRALSNCTTSPPATAGVHFSGMLPMIHDRFA